MAEIKASAEITPKFVKSLGSKGTGDGQFDDFVFDIAYSSDGNFIVASWGNLQVFSPECKFLRRFGKKGLKGGEINDPKAVAFDNDDVIVCDSYGVNQRVQTFRGDGTFIRQIGRGRGKESGQFQDIGGVAADGKGLIFVADRENNRIQVFKRDGSFVLAFGKHGGGDGEFDHPYGIAFAPTGELVVSDAGNHRIQVFTREGNFLRKFGSQGRGNGQFDGLRGICFDRAGRLVTEEVNHRVQVLSFPDGKFIAAFGERGGGDGQFSQLWSVCADGSGRVFVCDRRGARVQIWSLGQEADAKEVQKREAEQLAKQKVDKEKAERLAKEKADKEKADAEAERKEQEKQQQRQQQSAELLQVQEKLAAAESEKKQLAERLTKLEKREREREAFMEIPLSDLQLDKKIGGGWFGEVWLGLWKSRRRPVAIKRLLAQNLSPLALTSFKQELAVMHSLRSKYIVTLLGGCFEAGSYCLVCEIAENGSVFDVLHSEAARLYRSTCGCEWATRRRAVCAICIS